MDSLSRFLKKPTDTTEINNINKEIRTVKVYVSTNVGFVREHNEDNYYVDEFGIRTDENEILSGELPLDKRRVFAICDGMGGEDFGEEASLISVKVRPNSWLAA